MNYRILTWLWCIYVHRNKRPLHLFNVFVVWVSDFRSQRSQRPLSMFDQERGWGYKDGRRRGLWSQRLVWVDSGGQSDRMKTLVYASLYHLRWQIYCKGHFCRHGITSIPAWVSNNITSKVWDEIIHPFPRSQWCSHQSLGMDKQFHPTFYNGCNHLSMLGS